MDPWKSWAIVGVFGLGAAYYYSQSGKSKRGRGRTPPIVSAEQNQRRGSDQRIDSKDKRKKKGKSSDTSDQLGSDVAEVSSASAQTSTNGIVKKRKGGKKQPSKLAQSSAIEVSPEQGVSTENEIAEDEGMDNEEFARQLSGLKTGTSLKKPATQNENKKTKNQGKRNEAPPRAMNGSALKANGVASSQDMSTASSTTGADADDDLSPVMSPDLRATQAIAPSGTDISDMLEPAPKGPSVLRITEPANPHPVKQPKAQKAVPEPETKKQRQNRQKNEEKKAMREQAEKERRALLEKQLRTAREAEGRPAKNGLGPSQPPSTNVWNKPADAANDSTGPATKQSSAPLLDTFEDVPKTALNHHSTNGGANSMSVDKNVWNNDLPSEEEQMRMITEIDSDNTWSTVTKGGKGKKKSSGTTPARQDTSTTAASLANSGDNNKKNLNSKNNDTSNTMPSTSVGNNATSSGAKAKDVSTEAITPKDEDLNKTATSRTNDSKNEESDYDKVTDAQDPKHVSATYETIDHSVWTRENITEHPDYDPDFPYALTGHPDDDEWAVC
ncbi:hypothetical protein IMSHALPRED_010317 [Imshaugia aleurites]|uniref:Uncharacterized protein n=1 Tax=Imshaugia aleurites TaxID=172621 RepID=A0A8H3IZ40_9LECA|nr:hypothetical protein IMSHALPRED_010317 [Imshaugia aleurites]